MGDKPVTIRTLDAGGDKLINSVDLPAIEEKNPLMGLRAVRLSLEYPNILKPSFVLCTVPAFSEISKSCSRLSQALIR